LEAERRILAGSTVDVEALLLLVARPCAGESDGEIVAGAWDFERINNRYAELLRLLDERPDGVLETESNSAAFLRWAVAEREAWLKAVIGDPLLPERILPRGYLGQVAWGRRVEVLRVARRQLATFTTQRLMT
jgi:DNA-binding transcriptional regulator PaaX